MPALAPSIADFDPRSPQYLKDPHAAMQELLAEVPVFYHEPLDTYYVLRYEDARQVFGDWETFSNHAYKATPVREELRDRIPHEYERAGQVVQGGQILNQDPPEHTAQRRAAQRTFTHRRVAAAEPRIEAIAEELIDGFADQGGCDLMLDYGVRLTLRVVGTLLDVPREMLPQFQAWINDIFGILAPLDLKAEDVTTPDEQLVATYGRVHDFYVTYSKFVEERRANPGDDLCSAMLTITDESGEPALSNDDVLAHMVGITAAGTDTTANLIVNMVRFFTESPDQLRLVLDDPSLWENAMAEGLRRAAISNQVFRIARHDTEIAGVGIPAGATVGIVIPAANADPRKFPDPLRFDVRRENAGEHLALGRGRHFCLGAPLAPPEAQLALRTLYRRLPDIVADLDQELSFVPALSVRGIVSQQATWSAA
ncbi:MAG: cytochrome P450 [Solirubrobacterales bacterium]